MTSDGQRRILISAGEPSGDAHGGALTLALARQLHGVAFEGCGGVRMAAAGVDLVGSIEQLSAMGFLDVLSAIPRHVRLYRELIRRARTGRYQLAILIDYPGFHLPLGAALRQLGIPVLYYVAPQLWAWRPGRIHQMRRAVTRLAVILPFEQPWFASRGVDTRFVGHPLKDPERPVPPGPVGGTQVYTGQRVLGIFPGSRAAEVARHWPLFRRVAQQLIAEGRCDVALVAGVHGRAYPGAGPINVVWDRPADVMGAATAALIKSGTTTLEAAIAGVPSVVCYKARWSTYRIARALMSVDAISLVNLVAQRQVTPEFWHLPIDPGAIAVALEPLLDTGSPEHQAQCQALAEVAGLLGSPGAADRVASMALELLDP